MKLSNRVTISFLPRLLHHPSSFLIKSASSSSVFITRPSHPLFSFILIIHPSHCSSYVYPSPIPIHLSSSVLFVLIYPPHPYALCIPLIHHLLCIYWDFAALLNSTHARSKQSTKCFFDTILVV
jgi:hypothetical protein